MTKPAEAAAKNDAVVAKTRELVARYKASQAEVEDLRSKAGAPDPALVERSRALAARYKQLQGEKAAADAELAVALAEGMLADAERLEEAPSLEAVQANGNAQNRTFSCSRNLI